jgi:hypothetical protein
MKIREILKEESYDGLDNFVTMLRNLVGRYTSKKQPAKLNWQEVAQIAQNTEFELISNSDTAYDTFVSLWDKDPKAKKLLEPLIKNFNGDGIDLNIPGVQDEQPKVDGKSNETPQDAVEKMASGAVNQQIAQNQQGVQV